VREKVDPTPEDFSTPAEADSDTVTSTDATDTTTTTDSSDTPGTDGRSNDRS
jgi:hypothetical protein